MRERWPWRRIAATGAAIIAAAAPFLALQLIFNIGVTGRWNESPYRHHADRFTPGMTFGFHQPDPHAQPQTTLPQRLAYYDDYTLTATKTHRPERLWQTWSRERFPLLATWALPSELLLILVPPALLGLRRGVAGRGRTAFNAAPLRLALRVLRLPAAALRCPVRAGGHLRVLLGVHVIAESFPRVRPWLVTIVITIIVMLQPARPAAVQPRHRGRHAGLPHAAFQPAPAHDDRNARPGALSLQHGDRRSRRRAGLQHQPSHGLTAHAIVRAHDLSAEQNPRLFRHYADRQPARRVYVVERACATDPSYRPQYLGRVDELAGRR